MRGLDLSAVTHLNHNRDKESGFSAGLWESGIATSSHSCQAGSLILAMYRALANPLVGQVLYSEFSNIDPVAAVRFAPDISLLPTPLCYSHNELALIRPHVAVDY